MCFDRRSREYKLARIAKERTIRLSGDTSLVVKLRRRPMSEKEGSCVAKVTRMRPDDEADSYLAVFVTRQTSQGKG